MINGSQQATLIVDWLRPMTRPLGVRRPRWSFISSPRQPGPSEWIKAAAPSYLKPFQPPPEGFKSTVPTHSDEKETVESN